MSDATASSGALTARQRMKAVARRAGIQSSAPIWMPFAVRAYRRKLAEDDAFREWCESVGWGAVARHWGPHDPVQGEFFRLHLASQLYEITDLLRRRIGPVGDQAVLDAGASDGLFLSQIGAEHGVGLNFLEDCTRQIEADGYESCLGDVERMPFEDRSFPIVICCETLEHVPNPVAALNELARVCAGRIHLTVPWVRNTRISARPAGWPQVESHIFEFSPSDFDRVLSHANVTAVHHELIQVFPQPRNPILDAWLRTFMYPGYFPKLQYYELEPLGPPS